MQPKVPDMASFHLFSGGEAGIQNSVKRYAYHGGISEILVADGRLRIRFGWAAKAVGHPVFARWVRHEQPDYEVPVGDLEVVYATQGQLMLAAEAWGDIVTLYTSDGLRFDQGRIQDPPAGDVTG